MKKAIKLMSVLLCAVIALSILSLCALAAEDEFEASLSAFPKSYRAALRELHEQHPSWSFTALKTGIDWNEAVDNECSGGRSLFPKSGSSVFKSVSVGDYSYSGGYYIEKDGGFVTANRLAVAYYMDPRNFLNENNIFQFEDLSYNEMFDEAAVEYVLRGTFMYKTNITYYNAKGKLVETKQKYSTVICEAGKSANVNPCYLAAKIRSEVGSGTTATNGKNSTYPGIFNFYSIGASDGAGAVERGLKWASSGTTYNRPWNTPKKSIVGGAQYVASSYIAQGQYTAYLQKFNVEPDSEYGLYNHQYMTNVCAAATQAYFSYDSYSSAKLLDSKFSFSIPVFENMDDKNGTDGSVSLSDASGLSGKNSTGGSINIRKGPSTNNDRFDFQLSANAKVTVLDTVETDSTYYANVINYPFWYKISFNYNSKQYTGYVPKTFIEITSSVTVAPGAYEPAFASKDGKKTLKLISYDEQVATIENGIINFLKEGSAEVAAYDSTGRFSVAKYAVSDTGAPGTVLNLAQSNTTETSFTLSWRKVEGATGYTVYRYDEAKKEYVAIKTLSGTSLVVTPDKAVATYAVKARKKTGNTVIYSESFSKSIVAATKPAAPTDIIQKNTESDRYTLSWKKVENATGYIVYRYDKENNKYTKAETTSATESELLALSPAQSDQYKIQAYIKADCGEIKSEYSAPFDAVTAPAKVKNVKLSAVKENSYTLSWSKVSGASGYTVYRFSSSSGSFEAVSTVGKASCKISPLTAGSRDIYIVKAFTVQGKNSFYGEQSQEFSAATLPTAVGKLSQKNTGAKKYTLSWKKVSGADGYRIFKYDTAKKKFVFLTDSETNSLTLTGLKVATTTKYKVCAFVTIGKKNYYGAYSPEYTAATAPAKVSGLKATAITTSGYTLSWNKVKNAYGYRVFRYDEKSGSYTKVATIRGNSYKIKALKGAKSEKLIVKAFLRNGSANYFSAASKSITVNLK